MRYATRKHNSSPEPHWAGLEALEARVLLSADPMADLFNEAWYLAHNPDVRQAVTDGLFPSGYAHYVNLGQFEAGRNPSAFFRESEYLQRYPTVAQAVTAGTYDSGFQHFAEVGQSSGYIALALFDEQFYLSRSPDVAAAVGSGALHSGYHHFVRWGAREGRQPGDFFQPQYYLKSNPSAQAAVSAGTYQSGLEHYLAVGATQGLGTVFSERGYRSLYGDVNSAVAAGQITSGLQHYLKHGASEGRNACPLLQERYYLRLSAEAAAAVSTGALRTGLEHLVLQGQSQGLFASFDEARYLALYSDVRAAVKGSLIGSALTHYINWGWAEGRSPCPYFIEATYLNADPNIKAAVTAGTFQSGLQHYIRHGQFEGRQGRPVGFEQLLDGRLVVHVYRVGTYSTLGGIVNAFQVDLQALAAEDAVIAMDVEFKGVGAHVTPLYQVGWDNANPALRLYTPDMYQGSLLNAPGIDSHFLLNQSGTDWGGGMVTANEDNDFRYGSDAFGQSHGVGASLAVVAFISPGARAQSLPFAHIVVPKGSVAYLTGEVANGFGSAFAFGEGTDGIAIG